MPGAASLDLSAHEDVPARLDPRERPGRDALHLRNGLADLGQERSLSASGKDGHASAPRHTRQPRDDEIWPSVALAFNDDFGDRDPKLSAKLRERASFRGELAAKKWRENLQDEFFVEGKDEVGAGGEDVRRGACEAMAAGDIVRNRQPLRRIGAKGAKAS